MTDQYEIFVYGGRKMKTVVLITRENNERTTHVSVFFCGNDVEAKHFCHFANRVPLAGEDKLFTRRITVNVEYSLEKYRPFAFDDFVKLDDRTIQKVNRELDSRILAVALKDAKEEVKEKFFNNMSKRSESMLREDMEDMEPVTESDIENAKQLALDIYDDVTRENKFDEAWAKYKHLKENDAKKQDSYDKGDHIVLVFRGAGTAAEFVSVYLFDEFSNADSFCQYLNNLESDKRLFIYAHHAGQMTEYETTKPLLTSFDQILECYMLNDDYKGSVIIREALKKIKTHTILKAFKGLNKRYRMFIMRSLPIKTADEIDMMTEESDKNYNDLFSLRESLEAQQRILNAINRSADNFKKGKYDIGAVLMF